MVLRVIPSRLWIGGHCRDQVPLELLSEFISAPESHALGYFCNLSWHTSSGPGKSGWQRGWDDLPRMGRNIRTQP
eukprot:scaffold177_cov334-Pavlova_lutheri.AAC.46